METEANDKSKNVQIAGKIVELLEPLSSEDRRNVIAGSMALLGENFTPSAGRSGPNGGAGIQRSGATPATEAAGLSSRGAQWASQHGITTEQLERVFDIEAKGVPVIASKSVGDNNKSRSLNAYVLKGISKLLASGEPTFLDEEARSLCESLGCFDRSNHSATIADKGNLFSGSKKEGWRLTGPGISHGSKLVIELGRQ
jgi:hypothetical protein